MAGLLALGHLAGCGGGGAGSADTVISPSADGVVSQSCTGECGVVIRLSGNPNPEADVLGYNLYYGTQPGRYDNVIWVGNTRRYDFTVSQPGNYYFAVSTVDTSQNESPTLQGASIMVLL